MPSDKSNSSKQQPFGHNPFAVQSGGETQSPEGEPVTSAEPIKQAKNRGRVEIRRLTAGRGGKTVTEIRGFVGISLTEKEKLAKQMQKSCGTGGTVKEGRIEIQGDKRDEVARILIEAGFRPVFAGG
jgi:translation initiation factor 1